MSGFNFSAFAVREKALTLFLIVAVAAAGLVAFLQLGRAEDPSFTIKVMTVTAIWPGATPKEMQDLVADPLEKRLQELDHYDKVETFTRPGAAYLTVQFKDDTPAKDVPELFYQARKKLGDEARNLPAGVLGPYLDDEYSDIDFALYALKARGLAPRLLARQAETLRERLLHVPGVRKVNIVGEQPERIFVRFDYARLATLGIGAQTVFDALQRQNLVTPSGAVETRGPEAYVRLDRGYDDVEAVRQTPIAAGGRTLTLGDIATVERGYQDPPSFTVRHDGEPALVLAIVMQPGWNGLALGASLAREEQAIARTLPLGISFTRISDQARNIQEAVGEFTLKFFVALAVVMAVSFVALGFRVGLVVAAAVPLTLAAVFVIMLITGRVFDRITLGALILSLGLLVDDAIIAIEMMVVKMQEGLKREDAAAFAWTVTAAPMLAGTLVTIIGLMPVGFAQSSAGEYAGNIFWMVAFALLASWVVAVVFTPYLGVKMLPRIAPVEGGHDAIYATPLYARLRSLVTWCVDRRVVVALGVVGLFLVSAGGLAATKKQFFPNSDRPELIVEVYGPHGATLAATTRTVESVERWLKTEPDAQIVTSYIGQGAPRFFLSLNPELPDPSFAKLIVQTPDAAARDRLKARLRTAIAHGLAPEARLRVTQLLFGPPTPYPVSFRVVGPDLDQLRLIAARVRDVLIADPGMRDVNLDWGPRTPAFRLVIDQARLRLLGLTPKDAADQLQFLLSGAPVTQVREDVRTVEVTAQAIDTQRLDPARLGDLTLTTRDGRSVPVSQVGELRVIEEDPLLKRRDREPVITVRGDIDEALQPPDVTKALLPKLQPIIASLPAGYRIDVGGSVEEANKANVALAKVFPLMLLLMLATIMAQVRDFRGLLMVLLTAPLGLVGAAPTLLLFAQPFGFNAILGLIGLAGILMRNTLILLGQIEADQKGGMTPRDAVIEATVRRSRPVVLTAAAAMLAFVPLTLSSFWGPLAFTLIGGVGVGTILTLLFLPALYALFFRAPRADRTSLSNRDVRIEPAPKPLAT
jgi:multidrug efflux pump subunit AcrB